MTHDCLSSVPPALVNPYICRNIQWKWFYCASRYYLSWFKNAEWHCGANFWKVLYWPFRIRVDEICKLRWIYIYVHAFIPWLNEHIIPRPVILFVAGHSLHLTLQVSALCKENEVVPADVGPFKALKQYTGDMKFENIKDKM